MRNIFFLLFFTNCALANANSMIEYFNRFIITFSSRSVSKNDYASLVSYEIDPAMRANYDIFPPEQYSNIDNASDFVIKNTDILFSGGKSRMLFLNFVRENILGSKKVITGRLVVYNKEHLTYSFKIEKYQQDNVVIFENILAIIPYSEMSSEFSCFYKFKQIDDEVVKLVDVKCAG
ncbi:hypothetical protein [Atlantibacter subterraneus]|uniref:hypothetical protein n=1 Tax=Atlantibacter subterraneus TaxID=255519 RepID=UPI0028969CA8|nr:hypothetical protein [Atlantibacter subterranea]